MLYSIVSEYTSGKLREDYCNNLKNKIETCLTELSKLHNEEVVTEHELRSEILRPYISEKTAPRLHIMTGTGGQYDFDDVIQNENTFLSLLSNQIISIKPSGYNITITTIDKKTAQVMKEEYQERIAIIQKKLNNDVSRLEENIKKTGARFRMHPRMILLFHQ